MDIKFTDTSSALSAIPLLIQVAGGASGTTAVITITKEGRFFHYDKELETSPEIRTALLEMTRLIADNAAKAAK